LCRKEEPEMLPTTTLEIPERRPEDYDWDHEEELGADAEELDLDELDEFDDVDGDDEEAI
jgi:hypothetical protein